MTFKNEATVQAEVEVVISEAGGVVWRNNVGVLPGANGQPVRYGLANESSKQNKITKSSDLIGIIPIVVTADMVGKKLGVFIAVETKKSSWKFSEKDKRAVAQLNYINFINQSGGVGCFASDSELLKQFLKGLI